jgi:3-hydroxybutyryl-CoA dehydrogenase
MAATPPADAQPRVAVIGGGLMGHGIALVFARAGHAVTVQEPVAEARASLRRRIAESLEQIGADPRCAEAVAVEHDLERALAGADWVFEAAPEDLALKQELFAQLDALAPKGVVLASNSSVFRVADISARAAVPERIIGTHWWNPPFLVPLVEVIQGERTQPEVVSRTLALLTAVGKVAVHVRRDVAGFIGNRLQHALWREAFDLIDSGVCDAETIDLVVKEGFGRRLAAVGPAENADLVGLDLTLSIHDYLLPHLSRATTSSQGLRGRVERGELGMKTGKGWRTWTHDDAEATRARLREALGA